MFNPEQEQAQTALAVTLADFLHDALPPQHAELSYENTRLEKAELIDLALAIAALPTVEQVLVADLVAMLGRVHRLAEGQARP